MADYVRVPETDWQDICDAVRGKTGETAQMVSSEVAPAIEGITGDGEVLYYTTGEIYVEHVVVPDSITVLKNAAYNIPGIKSVYAPNVTELQGHYVFGQAWNTMEEIICPKLQFMGAAYWCNGGRLKTVQIGSVGYPVSGMTYGKGFDNNRREDLVITIYVDATTLAEVPTDITDYAPFGAVNATIVYRNSTTGEVISA